MTLRNLVDFSQACVKIESIENFSSAALSVLIHSPSY